MALYLTPAKIGLLALVEVYVVGAVPTEATVAVLHFLASHLVDNAMPMPTEDEWSTATEAVDIVTSIAEFERVLSPYRAATATPGRRLWDVFLRLLWRIDSLDRMHAFFEGDLPRLLALTKAERRLVLEHGKELPGENVVLLGHLSPLGTFVKQSRLHFSRLSFSKVSELWSAFVKYRQPTSSYWRRRNSTGIDSLAFDSVLLAGQHDWGGPGTDSLAGIIYGDLRPEALTKPPLVSTEDIASLLEFLVAQLSKTGARVPPEILCHYREILQECLVTPSLAHYLSFLESWRSGDYPNSFDLLHRYFDYTVQRGDRISYQYALLNMAVLQADFGCFQDAVSTMLEAVSTARENSDHVCLNFSLSWLFRFGHAHPSFVRELQSRSVLASDKEILAFLRAQAREAGGWVLWSSAVLNEAKMGLCNGESVSAAAELIVLSSRVVVEHNLKSAVPVQMSLTSAMYDRLGVTSLSHIVCEVFIRVHARKAYFDDEMRATCRLAGILAGRGQYDDAMARLEALDPTSLRAWKSGQYWRRFRGLIKLRRELHRDELGAADHLVAQLQQWGPESFEPDIVHMIDGLHVDALQRHGEMGLALAKTNVCMAEHRDQGRDIALRIRLLITKANLHARAGRPQKGFTLAMRAASKAWRARLLTVLWNSLGVLSHILVSLGEFAAAARILVAVIPRALETDMAFVAGGLYSVLADAYMGLAGELSGDALRAMRSLTPVVAPTPKSNRTGGPTTQTRISLTAAVARLSEQEPQEQQRPSSMMMIDDDDINELSSQIQPPQPPPSTQPQPQGSSGSGSGSYSKTNSPHAAAAQRMLEMTTKAVESLERAFAHFSAVDDLVKQCETRAKQATIMRVVGDQDRAEDYAAQYLTLKRERGATAAAATTTAATATTAPAATAATALSQA